MQKLIFVDTIKIQVSLAFILVDHNLAVIFRGENLELKKYSHVFVIMWFHGRDLKH